MSASRSLACQLGTFSSWVSRGGCSRYRLEYNRRIVVVSSSVLRLRFRRRARIEPDVLVRLDALNEGTYSAKRVPSLSIPVFSHVAIQMVTLRGQGRRAAPESAVASAETTTGWNLHFPGHLTYNKPEKRR